MTRILLARCASHERPGTLLGRDDATGLSRQGILEATSLALKLAQAGVTKLQASPQRRARETAALIAARTGLEIETVAALDEMDFGRWAGQPLMQLERDAAWSAWNRDREGLRPPGGEMFADVQRRITAHLGEMYVRHPNDTIVMITHVEPIRAAVLEQRNLPLSACDQINVAPASLVELGSDVSGSQYSAVA